MLQYDQILHGNGEISLGLHVGRARRRSAAWRLLLVWTVFWLGTVLQPCCQIAFAEPLPQGEEAHHGHDRSSGAGHADPAGSGHPCQHLAQFDMFIPLTAMPGWDMEQPVFIPSAPERVLGKAWTLVLVQLPDFHPPPPPRLFLATSRLRI